MKPEQKWLRYGVCREKQTDFDKIPWKKRVRMCSPIRSYLKRPFVTGENGNIVMSHFFAAAAFSFHLVFPPKAFLLLPPPGLRDGGLKVRKYGGEKAKKCHFARPVGNRSFYWPFPHLCPSLTRNSSPMRMFSVRTLSRLARPEEMKERGGSLRGNKSSPSVPNGLRDRTREVGNILGSVGNIKRAHPV